MNWKNLFYDHILERGYDYYCDGNVEDFKASSTKIRATVIGYDYYDVEISLKSDKITHMYCSCPYSEDGSKCKHMAAVLYTWEEQQKEKLLRLQNKSNLEDDVLTNIHMIDDSQKKKEAIAKIVAKADIDTLRAYLTSILVDDEKLLIRFCSTIGEHTEKEDVDYYIKQIGEVVEKYLDEYDYIDYPEVEDFIEELQEFYDIDVRRMIDKKQYMSAFAIINYIVELLGDIDMDDSTGERDVMTNAASDLWIELLSKVSSEEKDKMFQWFIEHVDNGSRNDFEYYVRDILMNEFKEEKYIPAKITLIENMIEKTQRTFSDWQTSFEFGDWLVCRLMLLEEQNSSDDEIRNYCKKYLYNSYVQDYYIVWCKEKGDFDAIIQLFDEMIETNKEKKEIVIEYIKKKKELYLLRGNKDAYLEQLEQLVFEYEIGNFDHYKELKKQYTEEQWNEKREEILQVISSAKIKMDQFYVEEKMYDKLLEIVMNSKELYPLQKYTEILKPVYPEKLLQKYQIIVNQMALQTGSRQKYQELVQILRVMKGIRGGKVVVDEIVKNWCLIYRNRPAMMDELRKL